MSSDAGRRLGAGEWCESKLVFIGYNLPEAVLRAALESCMVP